jgi:hypothetical protein
MYSVVIFIDFASSEPIFWMNATQQEIFPSHIWSFEDLMIWSFEDVLLRPTIVFQKLFLCFVLDLFCSQHANDGVDLFYNPVFFAYFLRYKTFKMFKQVFYMSQGQLLEMHLLESRLLNTFFKNVICSTQKVSTARQTKVFRMCTTFCFWAVDKKIASAQIFEQMTKFSWQ